MNERILEEIGLTKGEIKVYFTLMETGETTTGKIIEEAQISAGKVYQILDKLIKKGLVSYIVKEKTRYFSPASPKRILDFMKDKESEMKKREEELEKELPSLLKRYNSAKNDYETTLFKGLNGMKSVIFESLEELNKEGEILAMGVRGSKNEKFNILWEKWHNERIKKKISCKAIFTEIKDNYFKQFKKWKFTESRFLEGIAPSAITIMRNKVFVFSYEKESSVLMIKNPEIARSFTTFFNSLWDISKK